MYKYKPLRFAATRSNFLTFFRCNRALCRLALFSLAAFPAIAAPINSQTSCIILRVLLFQKHSCFVALFR